jgi:hypothetical protein
MPDEIKELRLEVIRLKSLCLRAAQEIKYLDCTIMHAADSIEGLHEWMGIQEGDQCMSISSVNLVNCLEGRTKGEYVENFPELLQQRNEIESTMEEPFDGEELGRTVIDVLQRLRDHPEETHLERELLDEWLQALIKGSVQIES